MDVAWTMAGFVLGLIVGVWLSMHLELPPRYIVVGAPGLVGAALGWTIFRLLQR
jgi:hypothetical protein